MSEVGARFPDPRDLLRKYDLAPKRSFSQNFLIQPASVKRIADAAAALGPQVVELGAGLGTLTHALLEHRCRVLAVELDRDMVRVLRAELGDRPDLALLQADAADLDFTVFSRRCGSKLAIVGNLPYQSTGAILRNVIAHRQALVGAILMVQREVRDRLVAPPGTKEYGALSVFTRAGFEVDTLFRLRPGAFYPAPDVESAVVRLIPRTAPLAEETEALQQVVRAAFQMRRKTLRNALRSLGDAERAAQAIEAAAIDGTRRGETLSIREFADLAKHWEAGR